MRVTSFDRAGLVPARDSDLRGRSCARYLELEALRFVGVLILQSERKPAMERKQRQQGGNANQKYPEQETQNPDRRDRGNRPGEANIDQDNRRPGQQSEKRRDRGERRAVEGEGESESESAKL
jgi:hypothetical protein